MLPPPPHLVTFLSIPGLILHKDSEEAKIQLAGGFIGKNFYNKNKLLKKFTINLIKILIVLL